VLLLQNSVLHAIEQRLIVSLFLCIFVFADTVHVNQPSILVERRPLLLLAFGTRLVSQHRNRRLRGHLQLRRSTVNFLCGLDNRTELARYIILAGQTVTAALSVKLA
jgi:hypothetical protein